MKCGLDFGTTNSSISVFANGKSTVLKIDNAALDPRVIRSMIFFERRKLIIDPKIPRLRLYHQNFLPGEIWWEGDQKTLFGQGAINKFIEDNKNRHPGIRRIMLTGRYVIPPGNPPGDPVPEHTEEVDYGTGRLLQALKSTLKTPFKGTNIFGKFYSVEEIIGQLVSKIREKAEKVAGQKIDQVTVGRPVTFSEDKEIDQRAQDRLEEALKLAGFKKINFIFEPIAAAFQFLQSANFNGKTVLVFDFGGGTLDTAIVKMADKPKVLATGGVYIGGDLLNADILSEKLGGFFGSKLKWGDHQMELPRSIFEKLSSWYSIPSLNTPEVMNIFEMARYKNSDPAALERLVYLIKTNCGFEVYEAIEKAKKELSQNDSSYITYADGPINLNAKISKVEFEKIIAPRVETVKEVVLKTLADADLSPNEIDLVVRTGGSSLIPIFENMLDNILVKRKLLSLKHLLQLQRGWHWINNLGFGEQFG